jgi:hypothetical protein
LVAVDDAGRYVFHIKEETYHMKGGGLTGTSEKFADHLLVSPKPGVRGYDMAAFDVDPSWKAHWDILVGDDGTYYYATEGVVRPFRWREFNEKPFDPLPDPVGEVPKGVTYLTRDLGSPSWSYKHDNNLYVGTGDAYEVVAMLPKRLGDGTFVVGHDGGYYLLRKHAVYRFDEGIGRWWEIYSIAKGPQQFLEDLNVLEDGTLVFERHKIENHQHSIDIMAIYGTSQFAISPEPETTVSAGLLTVTIEFDAFIENPMPDTSSFFLRDEWGERVQAEVTCDRRSGKITLTTTEPLEPATYYHVVLEHRVASGDIILCENLIYGLWSE